MQEFDLVVLTRDIDEHSLTAGDVGTIVHCYGDKTGYEVEFVTAEGKTIAVLTLTNDDFRLFDQAEILHTREIAPVAA